VSSFVARWLALPPNLRGILWVALSGLVFALLNVFTLIPAQHLNPYVMAFLRYLFGAMFLLPIVARIGLYQSLHTNRLGLHLLRGTASGRRVIASSFVLAASSSNFPSRPLKIRELAASGYLPAATRAPRNKSRLPSPSKSPNAKGPTLSGTPGIASSTLLVPGSNLSTLAPPLRIQFFEKIKYRRQEFAARLALACAD